MSRQGLAAGLASRPRKADLDSLASRFTKARAQKELPLMGDLLPLLKKGAGGRVIAGLKAYEE